MRKIFEGVGTALVTPFIKNKIDFPALKELICRQINMNVDAIVLLGTTGEICTLSAKERKDIVKFSLEINKDRVPLIFGIGGNNPAAIINLGLFIKKIKDELGYRKVGVMITSPYYNKSTQQGLFEYFKKITNTVKLPAIVYNIPTRTSINIEPETLQRITKLPFVTGIKEASGNIDQITEVTKLCPDTAVYSGDDTLALPSYSVGCQGIISVASNLDVAPVKKIYSLYKSGEVTKALELYQNQLPFYKSLFSLVNPIPIKYELSKIGLIKNSLRLPLVPK